MDKRSPKAKPRKTKSLGEVPRQGPRPKITRAGTSSKRDPVALIAQTNEGRIEQLVPIRHSRMMVSPFTFYRGAAAVMADDLAAEPHSGITVQCCGDCHILNFGAFATPERNIIIDMNDFDETHPAPFEWDVKRLATSLLLAVSSVGMSARSGEKAAFEMARSYQRAMAEYARARLLDVWYSKFDLQALMGLASQKALLKRRSKEMSKEVIKSSPEMLQQKLTERKNGSWRFKEMPPLLYHPPDLEMKFVRKAFELYLQSLAADRRALLRHFELADLAMKVVGTGSVGTFCGVLLLVGSNDDLLILQVKEAKQSVFEPYLGASEFENHGQRVVIGQRIMQSASDMFLGWTEGKRGRHFYLRQLRDVKMSPNPAIWTKSTLSDIVVFAGKILAKAHAKSGAAAAITDYLGAGKKFPTSIAKYALSYAEQTNSDYQLFVEACRSRRLPTEASVVG